MRAGARSRSEHFSATWAEREIGAFHVPPDGRLLAHGEPGIAQREQELHVERPCSRSRGTRRRAARPPAENYFRSRLRVAERQSEEQSHERVVKTRLADPAHERRLRPHDPCAAHPPRSDERIALAELVEETCELVCRRRAVSIRESDERCARNEKSRREPRHLFRRR